ncbi:MAG: SpoIIE family protein phosphatase [Pirellula sp.]|jgi:serine phosphatase RsbU (regulator of sigma subunit)|nr:SpoIIE family protein phosphatase [Pirellula sp.]
MGRRIPLTREQYVLGRHPDCDIVLESGAVSRQHAKASITSDGYLIEDLKSRNGTYVNGKLIQEITRLRDGDMVRICDIELVYYEDSEPPKLDIPIHESSGSSLGIMFVEDNEDDASARAVTAKLDVRGSQYGVQLSASAESKLAAILEIMKSLGKAVELDEVLPKVLDSLFTIFIQADRGFIILKDDSGHLSPRWTKTRRAGQEEMVRVSRTVLREVMQTKEAIISMDASSDQRFDGSQSVADFRIRSMIIAPLLDSDGEPIGAIQIDTAQQKGGFEQKDLEILIAVANQAGIAIENAQLHERMVQQRLVEQDLELARQVQLAFLPKQLPNIAGYSFFKYYNPAQQIGGDYFDFLDLDENRLAIVLADVVGHGVAAAMFMAKLSAETRFAFGSIVDPRKAMAHLNDRITALEAERFITMSAIVLDKATHRATIVIAGHMPPIMFAKDGVITEPGSEIGGPPLGIMSDIEFEAYETEILPGESLTMYTDGIFEAPNSRGEQYSITRVREGIQQANGDVRLAGEQLISSVRQHITGCEQEDDMCLVILGRNT